MPMLSMLALCFWGKSSGAALKVKVPSSFLIILNILMVSALASHVMKALQGDQEFSTMWSLFCCEGRCSKNPSRSAAGGRCQPQ